MRDPLMDLIDAAVELLRELLKSLFFDEPDNQKP